MRSKTGWSVVGMSLIVALVSWGCTGSTTKKENGGEALKGTIEIDGSSTVYLISEAMSKGFKKQHPSVSVNVGSSGTGSGFEKFANGETDISDASRPIKKSEEENCAKNGVKYVDFQVAWDGLTVVIHPKNTWAEKMTVEQLKKIWHPDTAAKKWSDVDPKWPNEEIKLFGAGSKSGTFDYFTEAINGKERVSRTDYSATEDDNVTAAGVAGNPNALGYFGLAYYEKNKDKLKPVAIAAKAGAEYILPTEQTVFEGTYKPLSRPLFIYVKTSSLKKPEVQEFVRFYLTSRDQVKQAGYIPVDRLMEAKSTKALEAAIKAQ